MIFYIGEEDAGTRIDKFLGDSIEGITRSYIQKVIEDGGLTANGKPCKASYKLRCGDEINFELPEPRELSIEAEDIPLDVIYEDDALLVVNKPQGMVVHPAPGNYSGTLVNALMYHCKGSLSGINGVIRPGIVHRIDKNTSGLLMVAKTNVAHLSLAQQIKEHSFSRKYKAIVHGTFTDMEGTVNAPIGRNKKNREKMCVTNENSKEAVTHWRVIEQFEKCAYVECVLETGRTHQIRVHMAHLGHPVMGDDLYGVKKEKFKLNGQLLHAYMLGFVHPLSGKYMEFTAPLPDYFKEVLEKLALCKEG
ncbi:MAG: RluA family pseudouridine synthase [Bacillota bacterium]|nr:RluA family pseudouridine synthase [Bacillota bacterium]